MEAVAFALPHLCLDQQHSELLLQPIRWSAHCNQQFQIKEEKKCSDDSLGLWCLCGATPPPMNHPSLEIQKSRKAFWIVSYERDWQNPECYILHQRRKPQNRLVSDSGALPLLGTSSETLFASSHFVCLQQGRKRQEREKILDGEARRGGEDMGVLSVCERTSGHESFRDRVVEWEPPCGTLPPLSPFSGSSDVAIVPGLAKPPPNATFQQFSRGTSSPTVNIAIPPESNAHRWQDLRGPIAGGSSRHTLPPDGGQPSEVAKLSSSLPDATIFFVFSKSSRARQSSQSSLLLQ